MNALRRLLASPWTWAIVACAVRLAAIAAGPGFGAQPYSDSVDYHVLASRLAEGRGFTLGPDDAPYPTTFRPPLLPLLVAPLYALFGPHYALALALQAVLSGLLALAAYALVRAIGGGGGRSALAAALVAFWPTLVYFSTALLTETLAALLVTTALVFAARLVARDSRRDAIALGVALGLAALARPTALPLAAAIFAWLALAPRRPAAQRLRAVAIAVVATALVLLPWTVRNRAVSGSWVLVTSGGGAALWDSNNPITLEDERYRGGALSLRQVEPYANEFRGMNEIEIDRASGAKARAFLAAHRDRWGDLARWKLARFFRVRAETPVSGAAARPGTALAGWARRFDPVWLSFGLLVPFIVAAGILALVRPRTAAFVLPLAVLVQAALAVVYWGSLRMRAPIEPALVVLAVEGLALGFSGVRGRRPPAE